MSQQIHTTELKRDKLDIMLRILEVTSTPVKKTHILYQAGINFYQLTKYLDLLLKTGMVEQIEEKDHVTFRTSEKGRVLMSLFQGGELPIAPPSRTAIINQPKPDSSYRRARNDP